MTEGIYEIKDYRDDSLDYDFDAFLARLRANHDNA